MRTHVVIRVISLLMVVVGLALSTSILVSWVMNDSIECIIEMAAATAISIFIPLLIYFKINKNNNHEPIGFREGFAIVTLGWIFASIVSAIPFCIVGKTTFVDGFFESISGFTTTGSSILTNIEQLPKGLLYWRAMTHWLGGMGIVVLSLAILPVLGVGGQQLFKAEVPGPISDQLTPRIADSAKILWGVYVLLTGLESLCLRIAGMTWFDAICHSMATMATGGFSTKQASIEFYHTPAFANGVYIDAIITVFMFLAGCNFILHLNALRGKVFNYFRDEEFRCYLWIVLFSIATLSLFLFINDTYSEQGLGYIIQNTSFTTLSIITTTGFCTGNFDIWPQVCRLLLLSLMFIGGCGGSTSGGIKVSRIMLLFRYAKALLHRCFVPHVVTNVQFNKRRIKDSVNHRVLAFLAIFMGLFFFTSLALTILEPSMNLESAISASIASLGNIGPGLGSVGAWENYAWLSNPSKILLSIAMLAGRLEIFTVMVLFLPKFWRK